MIIVRRKRNRKNNTIKCSCKKELFYYFKPVSKLNYFQSSNFGGRAKPNKEKTTYEKNTKKLL